jgi:hypothetical protein
LQFFWKPKEYLAKYFGHFFIETAMCSDTFRRFSFTKSSLGPMLWFQKYFQRKNSRKNGIFDLRQSYIMQKFDHDIVFLEKNANFFAESWQESRKIVIITSTPCHTAHALPCRRFLAKLTHARQTYKHQKVDRLEPAPQNGEHPKYYYKSSWGRYYDHNLLPFLPIYDEKISVFVKSQCNDEIFFCKK